MVEKRCFLEMVKGAGVYLMRFSDLVLRSEFFLLKTKYEKDWMSDASLRDKHYKLR